MPALQVKALQTMPQHKQIYPKFHSFNGKFRVNFSFAKDAYHSLFITDIIIDPLESILEKNKLSESHILKGTEKSNTDIFSGKEISDFI